jgi:nucleoside 2-deoxyribosyltransferase
LARRNSLLCDKCQAAAESNLIFGRARVYLAGNVEFTKNAFDWRENLALELKGFGISVLNPTKPCFCDQLKEDVETTATLDKMRDSGNFKPLQKFMKEVVRRDLRLIDISDFVIFRIEPSKPTFGTVHELIVALDQRKPCLIIIEDKKKLPRWLFGIVDLDLVFESSQLLVGYLKKIHSGKIKINEKYWRFLLPELR